MEDPWPFTQHLNNNYVPTTQELDELEVLVAEREAIIDAIDAEMAELERKRTANAQYVRRLRTLGAPVRRLPDDIVLTIFFESLVIAEPWSTPHPSVVASHVCRRWRGLALGTPLLWTKTEIRLLLDGLWGKVRDSNLPPPHEDFRLYVARYLSLCRRTLRSTAERARMFIQRSSGCPLQLQAVVYDDPCPRARISVEVWGEMFEPLAEAMSDPTIRWENISLDPGVVPESSLALCFVQIPAASSGLCMRNAKLRLAAPSLIPQACWSAVLPKGKLELSSTQLRSLSVRMPYADICRIRATWSRLTTLTFGSALTSSAFLP
jgi:hypothetical protein